MKMTLWDRITRSINKVLRRAEDTHEEIMEAKDAVEELVDQSKGLKKPTSVVDALHTASDLTGAASDVLEESAEALYAVKDLSYLTRDQLRKVAKQLGLSGYGNLNKAELIQLINSARDSR